VWLCASSVAEAQRPVPGQDAPRFEEAVTLWLSGEDDLAALRSFASLSNAGNVAAQILLSQIATDGALHAHVTQELARKERIGLLREKGGLSGTSWLLVAARVDPLAKAMLDAKKVGSRDDGVVALFEMGEPRRALRAAVALMHEGRLGELIETLARVENLPKEADWLLATAYGTIEAADVDYTPSAEAKALLERSNWKQKVGTRSPWNPMTPELLLAKIERDRREIAKRQPGLHQTPMVQFCARHCADNQNTCFIAGDARLSRAAPFPMRSPSEVLVSETRYWESARMDYDIARRVKSLAGPKVDLSAIDTCCDETVARLSK